MAAEPEMVQRIERLTPLADVLARIAALQPAPPRQIETAAATGRVLGAALTVTPRPRVALALRDGWAVGSDLTTDASSYAPAPLAAATRIDAGEPMPPGADCVAPLDAVVVRGGRRDVLAPVGPGEGVLPAGGDADPRAALLQQGQRITGLRAAVLATVGSAPSVVHEPRVRLVSTRAGDAMIAAITTFVAGEIGCAGGAVSLEGETLDAALNDDRVDAVIAVGGTGTGRHDASVNTLARIGRVEAHGITLSPGETAAFGFAGARPVLLLPGRLDAALAVWLVIGRPLLARLSASAEEEPTTKARLARKIASALGLAEVIPVRRRDGAAEPLASGYLSLQALAQADGWILVPAQSEGYPAGTEVVVRPLP